MHQHLGNENNIQRGVSREDMERGVQDNLILVLFYVALCFRRVVGGVEGRRELTGESKVTHIMASLTQSELE